MTDIKPLTLSELKFSLFFSEEDQEWVCTTDKFPSLSWLAIGPRTALGGYLQMLMQDGLISD
jgi:hypothetical protein